MPIAPVPRSRQIQAISRRGSAAQVDRLTCKAFRLLRFDKVVCKVRRNAELSFLAKKPEVKRSLTESAAG